ncbi:hypothetical protein GCM10027299_21510 [Larkinella ripae]
MINYFTHRPTAVSDELPEVVPLQTVCDWVKVPLDDREVPLLVKAAMRRIEQYCQQPIFRRQFTVTMRGFDRGYLGSLNISSIDSVGYLLPGETAYLPILDTDYDFLASEIVFTDSFLQSSLPFDRINRVQITFTAGYPADSVPEDIQLAILRLTSHAYNNRDDNKREFPSEVEVLLSEYKLISV